MEPNNEKNDTPTYIQVASNFPVMFRFWLPFTRTWILVGKDSLNRLRKQADRTPQIPDTHIKLAAYLLSEEPLTEVYAEEAVRELRIALTLLPNDNNVGTSRAQKNATVHKFLGDALIVLGHRSEAREHWKRTIALSPVQRRHNGRRTLDGFARTAQEMLNKYQA